METNSNLVLGYKSLVSQFFQLSLILKLDFNIKGDENWAHGKECRTKKMFYDF